MEGSSGSELTNRRVHRAAAGAADAQVQKPTPINNDAVSCKTRGKPLRKSSNHGNAAANQQKLQQELQDWEGGGGGNLTCKMRMPKLPLVRKRL